MTFRVEYRKGTESPGCWVVVYENGGARPATDVEVALWCRLPHAGEWIRTPDVPKEGG